MEQTTTTGMRRSLQRVLAVTAGLWGLSGPISTSVWSQAIGKDEPLFLIRQHA